MTTLIVAALPEMVVGWLKMLRGAGHRAADSIQIGSRIVQRIHLGGDAVGQLVKRTERVGNVTVARRQLGRPLLTARDQDIPNALSALDQLAYSVSTQVNAQNNAGTDLDGVSGTAAPLNIFNEPTTVSGSAANMSVVMTDPNQIAAAGAGDGTGDNRMRPPWPVWPTKRL